VRDILITSLRSSSSNIRSVCKDFLYFVSSNSISAVARSGSQEPRSVHPLGGDLRRSSAGIRKDDKRIRETTCQLPDVCPRHAHPIFNAHAPLRLSELLYLPLPSLPTTSQKADSILIGTNNPSHLGDDTDETLTSGGKWEDEEERRFFEDIQDLKDFVPKSVLGLEGDVEGEGEKDKEKDEEKENLEKQKVAEEVRKLEEELEGLKLSEGSNGHAAGSTKISETEDAQDDEDEYVTQDSVSSLLLTAACSASQHLLLGPPRFQPHLNRHIWRPKVQLNCLPPFSPASRMRLTALSWTKLQSILLSSIRRLPERG
jgi:hypothetical protein